jgi:UDP-N-acetylglucosamine 2-epimerase (non-hydrolysing)
MKLGVVVGTRPEIIKMAPIIRACIAAGVPYVTIHTGQHYSYEMDGIFFRQLGLPAPTYNLEIGSGSHPYQISAAIARLEPVLLRERPDVVLVEGDTNSVLAAGLAAVKLNLQMAHVESGLRSGDRHMPEEINRILVDHAADVLLAPTPTAVGNLLREGIPGNRVFLTGNTAIDEIARNRGEAERRRTTLGMGAAGEYAIATVHRAENVDDEQRLRGIVEGLRITAQALRLPIALVLHPRTTRKLAALEITLDRLIRPTSPLGYMEFLGLHAGAALILTDSGGLQEEACALQVPCVTLRDTTERPESVEVGASILAGADSDRIVAAARTMIDSDRAWANPFGDGRSGTRIVSLLTHGAEPVDRVEPIAVAAQEPHPAPVSTLTSA